jgi:type I restriction enzyme R subunit
LKEALLMKQAMSLCASMTTDRERREQAYFEAVRSTVIKLTYGGNGGKPLSLKEINAQINELLKASIQSEGVISLFDSRNVGENFSLFDPNILEEISKMKQKNIAVEILRKLLAEQVSLYKRTNLVQSQKFSEMITRIMNAYYNGLISNEKVIEEMLEAAEQMMKLHQAGEDLGLTQEELAFYDALTRPRAVQDFYNNDQLVEMTKELTEALRKNRTIDWQKKESARAGMRRLIKRLLKKYKYPPEEEQNALDIVLKQCEQWADVEPEYVYNE